LTIHVIQDVLNGWKGELPRVLYLQLDNTPCKNKNKFVIAYLHMLVKRGVFRKIKVGFLVVGHTHDQIDQMFSRFLVKLNKMKAHRLEALEEILRDSYKPKPVITFVDEVANFCKYVSDKNQPNTEGIIGRVLLSLHNINFQKQFWIREVLCDNRGSRVEFHGKHLSTCTNWAVNVPFVWYTPGSRFWVAAHSALKVGTSASDQIENQAVLGAEKNGKTRMDPNLITLEKYKSVIIDQGSTFFWMKIQHGG
jgi:hypothetical protein